MKIPNAIHKFVLHKKKKKYGGIVFRISKQPKITRNIQA